MYPDAFQLNNYRVFQCLFELLHCTSYKNIRRFPLRKYPINFEVVINEFANFYRFLFYQNNIFSISLSPHIYQFFSFNNRLKNLRKAFFLNDALIKKIFLDLMSQEWFDQAFSAGLFQKEKNETVRFLYRIVPYHNLLLVTSRFDRTQKTFTYLSYDSLFFGDFLIKQLEKISFSGKFALDIGCGVGILTFVGSKYCDEAYGLDLNPYAIQLARINADANHITNCQFICGSFSESKTQSYDLIVSNPPFIYYPESTTGPLDSDGGAPYGLGSTIKIIEKIPELLTKNGRAYILTRSPVIKGEDYLLNKLPHILPNDFGWSYHDPSDSAGSLNVFEIEEGIERFHHVIVEITKGASRKQEKITYPFFYRKMHLF